MVTAVEVPPTSADVLAGHGADGSQPIVASNRELAAGSVFHAALGGITPSTSYIVYVVTTDTKSPPTVQANPTAVPFTSTGAPSRAGVVRAVPGGSDGVRGVMLLSAVRGSLRLCVTR